MPPRFAVVAWLLASACSTRGGGETVSSPALTTQSPSALPVAEHPDPGALEELLASAPPDALEPTGPDGGTLVGTETGATEPTAASALPSRSAGPGALLTTGDIEVQPLLSTPAIERTARAQIYWQLAEKCHGPDGKPPPPDAVTLAFTIRSDSTVDPASVSASAADPRYEPTAECVLRTFSALPFRGPAAVLRSSARVVITWPSVD